MKREEAERLISLDIDGELAPQDKDRLANFLLEQPELTRLRQELLSQKEACQTAIPETSPDLFETLHTRVRDTYSRQAKILFWPSLTKFAVAASVLLAFLAGYYIPKSNSPDPQLAQDHTQNEITNQLVLAKSEYLAAIGKLERLAETQIEQMPPHVVMQITRNLREVDRAIAACENFAEAYPNQYLAQASLAKAYQAKVDLLETLVDGSFGRS